MKNEVKEITQREKVFRFLNLDTLISHQVELLSNEHDEPLLFYAYINTPVCIDDICKPMHIEIYWNLLGTYVGYGVVEGQPLTKFDHDEFETADYEKLHHLLSNEHSILKRKKMSDLFDKNALPEKEITYKGIEVDGLTGATKKEIKSSVVEGALYSCYTIWHLVHGEVKTKMLDHLASIYSSALTERFLYAEYADYQLYALKQMGKDELSRYFPQIITIFHEANPLIRTYILKKLPEALWRQQTLSQQLYHSFSEVDINTKTLLIKKLSFAHPLALEMLSIHIEDMSRNQLKMYLTFLSNSEVALTPLTKENLQRASRSETYTYRYLLNDFLEKLE